MEHLVSETDRIRIFRKYEIEFLEKKIHNTAK